MNDGVLIIDKPRGPTSFDVVAEVRRRLGVRRVGHTGTLDPMATGVLPVCLGEACKLVPFLTDCDKAYEAEVCFGVRTSTGDAEGEIIEQRTVGSLSIDRVAQMAVRLVGHVEQRPPMYSAVRVGGRRLYEIARAGETLERAPRPVVVHAIEVFTIPGETAPDTLRCRLRVRCGKGTYIRVIAEDLGELLGVGAHLTALRRTAVGRFDLAQALPLDRLADGVRPVLVPLAEAVAHLPSRTLDEAGTRRVRSGQERWLLDAERGPAPVEGRSRLLDARGTLVAVISRTGQKIDFERVFVDREGSSEAKNRNEETSLGTSRDV